jgi:two-component system response regulator HydG
MLDSGYESLVASGGAQALEQLQATPIDAVITDLRMEKVDGFDVLAAAQRLDPPPPVLIMTAFGAVENAVEAMRRGAYHYFTKPFQLEEVVLLVQRALAESALRRENRHLRQVALERSSRLALLGRSRAMESLLELVDRVAQSRSHALVLGESGTGKELVARALHFEGPRSQGPFVPVNCTALPSELLESELFGHAKGSFTGATGPRRGLFVEADGGTLFLDEIGDMAPELQAKLLRVLETGEVRPVGADEPKRVDVRVVAATHQDLSRRVAEGKFRHDLYYRLNVIPVRIPPLRDRRDDIPLLASHFVARARARNPRARVTALAPEVLEELWRRDWPGNVRELENVVERLVVLGQDEQADLALLRSLSESMAPASNDQPFTRRPMVPLRQLENEYIAWVIAECGGNKTRAAELLGIDVSTIHRRERQG